MTTALFGGSKTMEKDLNLVILTSDMVFQHIEVSLDLLCLLTLQLVDSHDGQKEEQSVLMGSTQLDTTTKIPTVI